jgi:hypothetical protein
MFPRYSPRVHLSAGGGRSVTDRAEKLVSVKIISSSSGKESFWLIFVYINLTFPEVSIGTGLENSVREWFKAKNRREHRWHPFCAEASRALRLGK